MIITKNNPTRRKLILEYTSYAKKDIQVSVDLTVKFLNAFQRWLHHRESLHLSAPNNSNAKSTGSSVYIHLTGFEIGIFKDQRVSKSRLQRGDSSKRNKLSLWRFAEQLAHYNERSCYPKSKRRHTVIRSAFVYKKTREQFGLQKRTYRLDFELTKCQQNIFVAWASQLKLPAELVVGLQ